MIFTDGAPDEGLQCFEAELKRLVTKKSTDTTVKVQIMACTSDDGAIGYLNAIDEKFGKVDVTDDYYSEQQEVVGFRRGKDLSSHVEIGSWKLCWDLAPQSSTIGMRQARRRRPAGIVTIRTATVMNNVTALSLNQEPLVVERFKEGIWDLRRTTHAMRRWRLLYVFFLEAMFDVSTHLQTRSGLQFHRNC